MTRQRSSATILQSKSSTVCLVRAMIGTELAPGSSTSRARRQRVPPGALGKYLCGRSLLLWIIALVEGISCLRLLEMSAPSAAIHGRGMWLNCSFDLESDELYSVKWYKNDTEFYRYIPRDRPPAQNYDLPGVVVDMSRSREGHVFIASVNLSTEGSYRCEASAEAPSFQTVVGEKEIKVFVIPDQPPKIRGTRAKYEVGERLDVSCRAPYSLPAAKLLWYINGHEVPFSAVHELETLYDSEGLQSSAVLLSFVLQPYHMIGSSLRLKCVSVISETFLTSSEELIVGDTVPFLPYPETSPHSPRIDGGLPKYRVDDLVNLTCRSAEYDRPPELRWFINDKEARPEYLVRYELHGHPKYAASLGLRFRVRPEHFEDERMHLRCTVTLSNVLNTSSVEANIKNKHRTMSGFRAASKDATNGGTRALAPLLSSILVFITLPRL